MTIEPFDSWMSHPRAIAEKRLLEVRYKRAVCLEEPHDYGLTIGKVKLFRWFFFSKS